MKRIQLIISALYLTGVVFLYGCGDKLEGTFYLSPEAKKYMIDTTVTSFKMVDNNGITEEFFVDGSVWYTTHHYFDEWGVDGKASGETYAIAYNSSLNNFFFTFVLRAGIDYSELEMEWNRKDMVLYNFKTKTVVQEPKPKIGFFDTLTVKGIEYKNIIELDYSNVNGTDDNTPLKTFISGEKGLIKIELKNNITLERIAENTQ